MTRRKPGRVLRSGNKKVTARPGKPGRGERRMIRVWRDAMPYAAMREHWHLHEKIRICPATGAGKEVR